MDDFPKTTDSAADAVADGPVPATHGSASQTAQDLPADLPPVQPPSASFIMQLFLVPAVIVAAVIGVWALFGQLSGGEQDWREVLNEVRSDNKTLRWRGATALAQLLRADIELAENGQQLCSRPEIASELTVLLDELLQEPVSTEELISQQQYVVTTLSWMDTTDVVLPSLIKAMQPQHSEIVRADAVRSVAVIADRITERGEAVTNAALDAALIEVSLDENSELLRSVAAYTMGLLPSEQTTRRLTLMLEDRQRNTRMNAAIALVRQGRAEGYPIFADTLQTAFEEVDPEQMEGETKEERYVRAHNEQKMKLTILANSLRAVRDLSPHLSAEQQADLKQLCQPIADEFRNPAVRLEATKTLRVLNGEEA